MDSDPGKVLNALLKQAKSRFYSRAILHHSEAVLRQRYSIQLRLLIPRTVKPVIFWSLTCANQAEILAATTRIMGWSELAPTNKPTQLQLHPAFEIPRNRSDAFDNASLDVASEWRNAYQR